MIKKLAIIPIIFLFFGCSSGDKEERQRIPDGTYRPSGFHSFISHGTDNAPVSLLKADSLYHLFYTTGSDEWGHISSADLLSWKPEVSFPLSENGWGEVIYDRNNLAGLDASWIVIFSDGDELFLKYSRDGIEWNNRSTPILKAEGMPEVSWSHDLEQWILTITNEGEASIYTSENLIDWKDVTSVDVDEEIRTASLLSVEGQWLLMLQGKTLRYQLGTFDGNFFQTTNSPVSLEGLVSDYSTFSNGSDETIFISKTSTRNSQLPSFSTPLSLRLSDNQISMLPVSHFQDAFFSKRRAKLNKLVTDGPSWFNFTIREIFKEMEIVISDNSSDLRILWDTESKKMTLSGSALMSQNNSLQDIREGNGDENLVVDILIDHASVDLFFNNGKFATQILTLPDTFFSKVEVYLDGEKYDPSGILYDIGI